MLDDKINYLYQNSYFKKKIKEQKTKMDKKGADKKSVK